MRTALVTGGGAGIGRAACMRLARDNLAVAVLGRRMDNAREVRDAIIAAGGRAIALAADVADPPRLRDAVAQARDQLGPVTVLVNNAGTEQFTPFARIGTAEWDRIMDVNLKAVYRLTQLVLPDMLADGWGRIINLTALGAQVGAANMAHYAAAKGGVQALTRSLAVELGRHGITVNAVSPGLILTPMAQRAIDGNQFPVPYQEIVAAYPVPRVGTPEEAATAIAYFASEEAGYTTGQTLGVNGGCYP